MTGKGIMYRAFERKLCLTILLCLFLLKVKAQGIDTVVQVLNGKPNIFLMFNRNYTGFYLNSRIYEKNGFFYLTKTNKLLDDTILYCSYHLVQKTNIKWGNGDYYAPPELVPGKMQCSLYIINGRAYLFKSKLIIDSSYIDTMRLYKLNSYCVYKKLYFPRIYISDSKKKYQEISFMVYPKDYQLLSKQNEDIVGNPLNILYYPNGSLKEIITINGKFGSLTKYYYKGNIAKQVSFNRYRRSEKTTYYKDGLKKTKSKYYFGQTICEKWWERNPKKNEYYLLGKIEATPLLLLDAQKIKYLTIKPPSPYLNVFLNKKLWLSFSNSIFQDYCGCKMKSEEYYNEFGQITEQTIYKNDSIITIYPNNTKKKEFKKIELVNLDTIKQAHLKNKILYYDKNGRLLAKDINYTKSSGKKNIRWVYPKKGKAIKQVYDETTSKYLPVK